MNRAQQKTALFVVLVAALLALLWWSNGSDPDSPSSGSSGSETITVDRLPDEAVETIDLIRRGGPFPYPGKDGSTFGNREHLLPEQPRGFYREYTVLTPGSQDRGARRIITGGDTMYWTPDHYRSFARIIE